MDFYNKKIFFKSKVKLINLKKSNFLCVVERDMHLEHHSTILKYQNYNLKIIDNKCSALNCAVNHTATATNFLNIAKEFYQTVKFANNILFNSNFNQFECKVKKKKQ